MKPWDEMTEKEIIRLKRNQCIKCKYFTRISTDSIAGGTCDYIGIVGHRRGCSPLECVAKGIFKKKEKNHVRKKKEIVL